jgi:hypothetical protein
VLPREEKTVLIDYTQKDSGNVLVSINGWNVDQKIIEIR